ncbi:unnamed protein product [Cyclocybe aegerita]|uniref:Uncharacterized protein n=1 Tax=Cyclocybe aegerita TaxID=1973307 RepID=A0A8S0XRG2_CYCAE|nr:unnamed protein product [Cyclocybe aegerita]
MSSYVIPDPSFLLPTDNPKPNTIASCKHTSNMDVTKTRSADKSKKARSRAVAARITTTVLSSSASDLEDADTTIISCNINQHIEDTFDTFRKEVLIDRYFLAARPM